MGHTVSFINAMIATAMVGGGAYLHKLDSGAKATLAEASRISLESRERSSRIQAKVDALAAEHRALEASNAQLLQEIAERESRLREQAIAALESQARQAEQIPAAQQEMEVERQRMTQSREQAVAAQRLYEESLNQWAAAQRQRDETRWQEERARLAVAEERARMSMQAAAIPHVQVLRTAPVTVVWHKAWPTTIVRSVPHFHPKPAGTSADPRRPCTLQPGFSPAATLPGHCR